MNFKMTKIAALAAMAFASTGAHAVLTSTNTLSIGGDAVTTFGSTGFTVTSSSAPGTAPLPASWHVSSNGAALDSFFTMGGSTTKDAINVQYAFLYNGADLTLSGATQANAATWTYYGAPGSNETVGTGISILSASGDVATVNMSGWKVDWNGVQDIPMGTNATWLAGYSNGVGQIKCATGSGCAVGSKYTLKYAATVPAGDASGFGNVQYYLQLHGTVGMAAAVPEASTYGMMLAGLGLVGFAVRRRTK